MTGKSNDDNRGRRLAGTTTGVSRRTAIKGAGALAGVAAASSLIGLSARAHSGSDAPIRIGFQVHRTGIGAAYGSWYERTSRAAVDYINETGGIGGLSLPNIRSGSSNGADRRGEV